MVDGRLSQQWEQVSWLMAAMYNAQPGERGRRPVLPHRLNPYRGRRDEDHDLDDVFGL